MAAQSGREIILVSWVDTARLGFIRVRLCQARVVVAGFILVRLDSLGRTSGSFGIAWVCRARLVDAGFIRFNVGSLCPT